MPGRWVLYEGLDASTEVYAYDDGSFGLHPLYDARVARRYPYAAYTSLDNAGADGACSAFAEWRGEPCIPDAITSLAVMHWAPRVREAGSLTEAAADPDFAL